LHPPPPPLTLPSCCRSLVCCFARRYLKAGDFEYDKTLDVADNVISTQTDFGSEGESWIENGLEARFELTQEVKERATLNILLTIFLSFLFALGSFIFNNDAHELMFKPVARLTNVTSKISSQLFSIEADSINGSESSYIESVLTKIARFFETEMHKVTTLYTPDNSVWTIDVRKEKEEIARVVGSTHRITSVRRAVRAKPTPTWLPAPCAAEHMCKRALGAACEGFYGPCGGSPPDSPRFCPLLPRHCLRASP
jgi:hypothetical protein